MRGLGIVFGMLGASLIGGTMMGQVAIKDIGNLGGTPATAIPGGMSSNGDYVVGYSMSKSGLSAFIWSKPAGKMTILDHGKGTGATQAKAYDVSSDGRVVVGDCKLTGGGYEGMIWKDGVAQSVVSEYPCAVYGVSNDGTTLALTSTFTDGPYKKSGAHIWADFESLTSMRLPMPLFVPPGGFPIGSLTGSLPYDISGDGTTLVGISMTSMARNAVRWVKRSPQPGMDPEWEVHTFEEYPDSESSYAYGVSYNGTAVAGLSREEVDLGGGEYEWRWHAFKWTEPDTFVFLQPLPGHNYSEASAISDDGEVVVGTSGQDGPEEAVYWDQDGIHKLADEVKVPEGWQLRGVKGVNRIGTCMTGWGTNANGNFTWVLTGLFRDGLQDAEDRGDGWAESDWYGFFWRAGKSHVWHYAHGWEYVPKGNRDSVMVYDYGLGQWVWNHQEVYPFLYMYGDEASWMWFYEGTQPGDRWFFHYGKNKWIAEANLSEG